MGAAFSTQEYAMERRERERERDRERERQRQRERERQRETYASSKPGDSRTSFIKFDESMESSMACLPPVSPNAQ
jgi:hypothetical protein